MTGRINKLAALLMSGLALTASLLTTATLAAPPKGKKPPKKPPVKKDTKSAALIAAGKKVYEANGCKSCHAIAGDGGMTGPELTKIAADPKHDAKWLETAVVNPKAHNPNSAMPAYEDTIKGKDLKGLVAYLGSLKGDKKDGNKPSEPKKDP